MNGQTLVINGDIIAKNANYIGGYLKLVVETVLNNQKSKTIRRLDTKRYFGKSFDMSGVSPLEMVFRPYYVVDPASNQEVQPMKGIKFGSNDINLFAYAFDMDKKEDGTVKDADIVWLAYNADDWDNAAELNKDIFPVVRDHYGAMVASSHTLDKANEIGYQKTLVRLGDINENAAYCVERGLTVAPPQEFQEQFALAELFANVVQVIFGMTEDIVNGRIVSKENKESFVGIAEYVADQQKLQTNIYSGGLGLGAQPTFMQQLYMAQSAVKR